MKNIIKENKVLFVLALVIIIALFVLAFGVLKYFYGTDSDKYGDRLKDIENHPIKETISEEIKSLYGEQVQSVKVDVKGKIIYIIMDVSNGVSKDDSKNFANQALEKFSEEDKNYYDIQFLISCKGEEAEEKTYPIEGYKNSSSTAVVWTNN